MALVPEPAHEKAALLHGRGVRLFILVVILLGGFFAISYFGQPGSAAVEADATGRKVGPPATQPAQVLPKEPSIDAGSFKTLAPHRLPASTYLQLSAVRQQSAERMRDDLRKKNFEAVASEIEEKPGLFRVLVGPVSDTGVVQLRADLERAGFPGNAAVRRTFKAISLPARTTKEEASNRPVAGQTYMELSAASRDSAQQLVDALRRKKFNAMASEIVEKPGMFRVLVGPVEEMGAGIAQMRADLEGAGFPGDAAIRRIPAEPDPALSAGATKADESNRPVAGQAYLEFSATSPQTAEIIADALHQKGFEAIGSETEDPPGGFRVVVRPVNNTSIDQLRADLERAGFHGDAAILRISK